MLEGVELEGGGDRQEVIVNHDVTDAVTRLPKQ